jgi:hypothetical protein
MEVKDIGRIIGAAALAVIPAAGGLYAFGKMKDKKQNTGPAALVGGLTLTLLGVGVALINYYMLGLNETAEQLTALIGEKQTTVGGTMGALMVPDRVFSPYTGNFRKLGMLNVERQKKLGLLNVTRTGMINAQRVGCCGQK